MRVVYIAAGAAGAYCGACTRDVTLVRALGAAGHDVALVPLYTPLRTDLHGVEQQEIFYGGLNVYLQEHAALFRRTPRAVDRLLDRPALLRAVGRWAVRTRPEDLGRLTVSVLRGAAGRQRKEMDRLIEFLRSGPRPHVVHLTNSLLGALAPEVRARVGAPVVCTLEGEEAFVARLPQPWRREAQDLMRSHAAAIDLFASPGAAYAERMSDFLSVPRERIRVVRCGVEAGLFARPGPRTRRPFRVGFLGRLSPLKGLDVLCGAFIHVAERCGEAELRVAGQAVGPERRFWAGLLDRLRTAGLADRVRHLNEPDLAAKADFLRGLSAFSVPVREDEPRLVACIEAMAAGVPVVGPERGLYPELIALTGGGLLVRPDDPSALADALLSLHQEPDLADDLGRKAAEGVARHFCAERMAEGTLELYREVAGNGGRRNADDQ